MSYSANINLFWELLDLGDAELMVDNDMCVVSYNFPEDEEGEPESQAFDFGPEELAFMFGERLGIYMVEA